MMLLDLPQGFLLVLLHLAYLGIEFALEDESLKLEVLLYPLYLLLVIRYYLLVLLSGKFKLLSKPGVHLHLLLELILQLLLLLEPLILLLLQLDLPHFISLSKIYEGLPQFLLLL